ncbi:class I SAM-dependent methyltransferase [Flindersiella endophytica]
MNRYEFLGRMHEVFQPRTYFEIGVNDGRSLTLSRVPTVAVDPAHKITTELACDLRLVKATSDDFFKRDQPMAHLGDEPRIDLAFIDGMHLFEFVLRDFINAEKYADWTSVVVFDDQLPRNIDEAARDRHTTAWTGDVYKIIPVLQRYRPDLRVAVMDTTPTGVTVIFGMDPSNTVLSDKYDEIMETYLLKDPQQVPDELLTRSAAMTPDQLFGSSFWKSLLAAREDGSDYGREQLIAEIDQAFADLPTPNLGEWAPDPSVGRDDEAPSSDTLGEQMAAKARKAERAAKTSASKDAGSKKPAASASGGAAGNGSNGAGKAARSDDFFSRMARKAPFLAKIPGAKAVVSKLR